MSRLPLKDTSLGNDPSFKPKCHMLFPSCCLRDTYFVRNTSIIPYRESLEHAFFATQLNAATSERELQLEIGKKCKKERYNGGFKPPNLDEQGIETPVPIGVDQGQHADHLS